MFHLPPKYQPWPFPWLYALPLALPLQGHWLTGGCMVLSQLCMVLSGEKGGDRKRKVQEGEHKWELGNTGRTRNREREGLKKCVKRFWMKIKRWGREAGASTMCCCWPDVGSVRAAGWAIVGSVSNSSSSSGRSRSHTGRQHIFKKKRRQETENKEKKNISLTKMLTGTSADT